MVPIRPARQTIALLAAGLLVITVTACTSHTTSGAPSHVTAPPPTIATSLVPTTTSAAAISSAGTMQLGIEDSRDSPWATITFLAQNHWSGYVGKTYYSVYAGVDRHGRDQSKGTSAVGVQVFPTVKSNPIYDFGTGTTPLKVLSVKADVATLSDGATRIITFDIGTRHFEN